MWHNASRLFVEQPRIYPLSSAVYTPTLARRTQQSGGPFFFPLSRPTSFLDIKAFNIERRIAMRPDSARDQSVLLGEGREFRDKFSLMRQRCRFDKSRRRATRFAVGSNIIDIAMTFSRTI